MPQTTLVWVSRNENFHSPLFMSLNHVFQVGWGEEKEGTFQDGNVWPLFHSTEEKTRVQNDLLKAKRQLSRKPRIWPRVRCCLLLSEIQTPHPYPAYLWSLHLLSHVTCWYHVVWAHRVAILQLHHIKPTSTFRHISSAWKALPSLSRW